MTKNIDRFMEIMEDDIRTGIPLSPVTWIERAMKINIFISSEIDIPLYEIESKLAKERAELLKQPNMTVAKAKVIIEATDEYKESKILRAKKDVVQEQIKLAKKYADTTKEEYHRS